MSEQIVLPVQGMSCGHCVARVDKALRAVEGVAEVEVSLEAGEARLVLNGDVPVDRLIAAVNEAGYQVPVER